MYSSTHTEAPTRTGIRRDELPKRRRSKTVIAGVVGLILALLTATAVIGWYVVQPAWGDAEEESLVVEPSYFD
jgi:cell division septal protein FtsQ